MVLNPNTDSISINWYGTPCHCRCRHCLLGYPRRVTGVSFDRASKVAERYAEWAKAECFPIGFSVSYACDSPESLMATRISRRHGMFTGRHLLMSGSAFRKDADTRSLLDEFKAAGTTHVGLTFRGVGEGHDKQVGREGDFEYQMYLAELIAESGLQRVNGVLVLRETVGQLSELISLLEALPGPFEWCVSLLDHRGNAKRTESDRVTLSDIEALPDHVREMIGLSAYTSEALWVEQLIPHGAPKRIRRCFIISLWEENIEKVEGTGCGEFLAEMDAVDARFQASIPSLPELARLYGDTRNDRLYTVRDLEWKWTERYLEEHTEVPPTGRFDDTETCVLWQYPRTGC